MRDWRILVETVFTVIAAISAVILVISVMMQDSKNAGFSAAMGGSDTAQFTKGSREELFDKITKASAVVWIVACAIVAILKYTT